jgi:hypothetical protein
MLNMDNKIKMIFASIAIIFAYGCQTLFLTKPEEIPNNINESFTFLDKMFDDTTKYSFMTLPEDITTSRLHFGFGMWMRNNWGLWGDSPLRQSLIDSGFVHPDDMSSAILIAYHRRLNGKPLRIREEAEKCLAFYKKNGTRGFSAGDMNANQEEHTNMADLIKYFPVGDTIIVSVYATYNGNYASSVRGSALVRDHVGDSLLVYLMKLENKEDHKPERKEGEIYKISLSSCDLIPPKNWTWKK